MDRHKHPKAMTETDTPSTAELSRRTFLHTTASIAEAGLLLKDSLLPEALFALPSAASNSTEHRIAATPTHSYRPYRSKRAKSADVTSWVQIDLGTVRSIDAVLLYPANQRTKTGEDAYYTGEGFPLRFKIETSSESGFGKSRLIADYTAADFKNPKDTILNVPAANKALTSRFLIASVPEVR